MDLPGQPFINIPHVANLRDIGGYPIDSTHHVRKGIFYRSADPCKCSPSGIDRLRNELNISAIFDLRAKQEIDKNANTEADVTAWEHRLSQAEPDAEADLTITRYWAPVFAAEVYSPEAVALRFRNYAEGDEGFAKAYEQILIHGRDCFGQILRHLASIDTQSPRNGVLVHCTAGKDRTGVLTAVLLSLLGVDDDQIAEEYVLTEIGLKEQKPIYVKRLMAHKAFSDPDGPGEAGAIRMTTCTKENMLATLRIMKAKYGSAEEYVTTACGLSKDEVESIRQKMVVAR